MSRFSEPAYALFRIVLGALFAMHGAQKLFGVLGGTVVPTGSQMWIGGVIELCCGLAICVGFFANWAAFLASGTMAVAYFQFHQPKGTLPIQNGGELAVVFCFAFLVIATRGAGIWSLSGRKKSS